MDNMQNRLLKIQQSIENACARSGRSSQDVKLLAVTKFVPIERIVPAVQLGIKAVGENRAQELVEKEKFFRESALEVHFIGQLQTNKVKYVLGVADLIQSIDRISLAKEVERQAVIKEVEQNILIQINIGEEVQKGGISIENVDAFLDQLEDFPHLHVKGLMCVPPIGSEFETRHHFARMYKLFERLKDAKHPNVSMEILSMGMSGDYEAAILEGSTMIRVGTAIFGSRM